jgi:hypothetical protein
VAIAHDLYKSIGNIEVFTESELLQVKVPMVFLVTGCFSCCRHELNLFRKARFRSNLLTLSNQSYLVTTLRSFRSYIRLKQPVSVADIIAVRLQLKYLGNAVINRFVYIEAQKILYFSLY